MHHDEPREHQALRSRQSAAIIAMKPATSKSTSSLGNVRLYAATGRHFPGAPVLHSVDYKGYARQEPPGYVLCMCYRDDRAREREVESLSERDSLRWQEEGLVPDMLIEPGDKTDEPIKTRGWTHWHHLFGARGLLTLALFRQRCTAERCRVSWRRSTSPLASVDGGPRTRGWPKMGPASKQAALAMMPWMYSLIKP